MYITCFLSKTQNFHYLWVHSNVAFTWIWHLFVAALYIYTCISLYNTAVFFVVYTQLKCSVYFMVALTTMWHWYKEMQCTAYILSSDIYDKENSLALPHKMKLLDILCLASPMNTSIRKLPTVQILWLWYVTTENDFTGLEFRVYILFTG